MRYLLVLFWFSYSGIWNNRYYPMTSLITTVNRSAAHDLLVVGDTDGYLRLFRFVLKFINNYLKTRTKMYHKT